MLADHPESESLHHKPNIDHPEIEPEHSLSQKLATNRLSHGTASWFT
jgi:hypothetical protein